MRADRLLDLVKILRRSRHPVTAQYLADELAVTVRTIYRDVQTLVANGTPIRGEAGIGYQLEGGYDLPPLMFTVDELEALMLGARMVSVRADPQTANAAVDAIRKIEQTVPKSLRKTLLETPLYAPFFSQGPPQTEVFSLGVLRSAFRTQHKIAIAYQDQHGMPSRRVLWPLSLAFFPSGRALVAWCELREDFRHFRTDRIQSLTVLDQTYATPRRILLARWWEQESAKLTKVRLRDPLLAP